MPVQTQYVATRPELDGRAVTDFATRHTIGALDFDASNLYHLPLKAGVVVLSVRAHIATAFDVASTIDIGIEGATTDGFIDSTTPDLDPTSLNAYANSQAITANAYAKGYYTGTAAKELLVTLNGNPTVGSLVVEILYDGWYGGFERGVLNSATMV